MWALVRGRNVIRVVRALPFTHGGKRYAGDPAKFPELLPVRRVQVNAPEDTTGWSSTSSFTVQRDHVLQEVTWTEDDDADEQRAERDRQQEVAEMKSKQQALREWMAENGHYTETTLSAQDFTDFENEYNQPSVPRT